LSLFLSILTCNQHSGHRSLAPFRIPDLAIPCCGMSSSLSICLICMHTHACRAPGEEPPTPPLASIPMDMWLSMHRTCSLSLSIDSISHIYIYIYTSLYNPYILFFLSLCRLSF